MTQIAGTVSNASSRELKLGRNFCSKREHSRLPLTRSRVSDKAHYVTAVSQKKKKKVAGSKYSQFASRQSKTRYNSDYLLPSDLYVITKSLSYFMAK